MPVPKVIEGSGYVKCILPRPTMKKMTYQLTNHEETIMHLLDLHEEVSPEIITQTLLMSRQTTTRLLSSLIQKGLLIREGLGKKTVYKKT